MRKPRDFDSEMKALNERTKLLKERKLHQLGELVIATGADVLPIDVLAGALLVAVDTKDSAAVEGWRKRGAAFFQLATRNAALAATRAALQRATAARNRLLATRARYDTRAWQVKRRERTRQLIELGGLIVKADLVALTNDDRAAIFGLLVEAAATLQSERCEEALSLWRRRGKRAFESQADDM